MLKRQLAQVEQAGFSITSIIQSCTPVLDLLLLDTRRPHYPPLPDADDQGMVVKGSMMRYQEGSGKNFR